MELARFSDLILAWQRLALEADADSFRREALGLLQAELAFSSAWWGMGHFHGGSPAVLQSYLHQLPPEFIADWWRIANFDELAKRVAATPTDTVLVAASPLGNPEEEAFDARWGLSCALSTRQTDASTGLHYFVSLFRDDSLPDFSEADRRLVQLLTPHLLQAEQLHWRLGLTRRKPGSAEHRARVDAQGHLVHAAPSFCRALMDEFPEWSGNSLPPPLLPLCQQRSGHWQGRHIELSLEPAEADGCNLELTRRLGHGLTRREEMVARAFAAGDSYKEIARNHDLSPATVRSYLRDCYLKLGVNTKSELGGLVLGRSGPDPQA